MNFCFAVVQLRVLQIRISHISPMHPKALVSALREKWDSFIHRMTQEPAIEWPPVISAAERLKQGKNEFKAILSYCRRPCFIPSTPTQLRG